MPRRRRRRRRPLSFKPYLLIFLACSLVALVLHFLYGVPDQVQEYADQQIEEAVRKAVKTEVQEATRQQP